MIALLKRKKTTQQIIEEIHEDFYTEVDKLLEDAKIIKTIHTDKQRLIDKSNRLKSMGFIRSNEVVEGQAEKYRLERIEQENEEKKDLIEAINYFSFKYPQYKFITEKSVKKICEKYGLIYGSIENYKGFVPDKNLRHIEKFEIKDEDKCFCVKMLSRYSSNHFTWTYGNREECHRISRRLTAESDNTLSPISDGDKYVTGGCTLEIAAPVKDFDLKDKKIKDFKISKIPPPDPVVLFPVPFKNKKHYLIVTAWGDEASDELVVNEKMN